MGVLWEFCFVFMMGADDSFFFIVVDYINLLIC